MLCFHFSLSSVRARTRRFFTRLDRLKSCAPLVEASSSHPPLSPQLTYLFAGFHTFNDHPLEFPGGSFPLDCPFLSRKVCPSRCANSSVQLILGTMGRVRSIRTMEGEQHGLSVFFRFDDDVFRAYSTRHLMGGSGSLRTRPGLASEADLPIGRDKAD